MSTGTTSDDASLAQLQNAPIDIVLNSIDHVPASLPSYRELYYRWERQQWQTQEIDLVPDRIQWEDLAEEEQEGYIVGASAFFQGEASVTNALGTYILAAPNEEIRIFLTTQQVDEARHTILFDRFFCEVLGIDQGSITESLAFTRQYLNKPMQDILIDELEEISERLGRDPYRRETLVEAVSLYHIIVEGTLGLAGERSLLEEYRREQLFPGFRAGLTAVVRDESRHVIFGLKFLRDMLTEHEAYKHIIEQTLMRLAPVALAALTPSQEMCAWKLSTKEDPWITPRYGRESLRKKLKLMGLQFELPSVPPPPSF